MESPFHSATTSGKSMMTTALCKTCSPLMRSQCSGTSLTLLMSMIHTIVCAKMTLQTLVQLSNSHGLPEARAAEDDQNEARPAEGEQNEPSPKRARLSPEFDLEYELGRLMEEAPTFNADDAMDAPMPEFFD